MIINKNEIWVGLGIGLLLPIIGYFVFHTVFEGLEGVGVTSREGFSFNFRQRTLSVVAICLNLIPLNYFQRKRHTQSIRGLVFPTTAFVVAWVIYFGPYIF